MKNTIQITDSLTGVIVPVDANPYIDDRSASCTLLVYDYNFIGKKNTDTGSEILPIGNWKIHGLVTLPELKFDFDYLKICTDVLQLKEFIFKAIQDAGLLLVNPLGDKEPQRIVDYTGRTRADGVCVNSGEIQEWQDTESKIIKGNLLILEKIK